MYRARITQPGLPVDALLTARARIGAALKHLRQAQPSRAHTRELVPDTSLQAPRAA